MAGFSNPMHKYGQRMQVLLQAGHVSQTGVRHPWVRYMQTSEGAADRTWRNPLLALVTTENILDYRSLWRPLVNVPALRR